MSRLGIRGDFVACAFDAEGDEVSLSDRQERAVLAHLEMFKVVPLAPAGGAAFEVVSADSLGELDRKVRTLREGHGRRNWTQETEMDTAPSRARSEWTPPGVPAEETGVAYAEYVRRREDPRWDHLRMTFLDGTFTCMAPEGIHEVRWYQLGKVVEAAADALGVPRKFVGAMTIRRGGAPALRECDETGAGKEADAAYYLGAAEAAVRGVADVDLAVHPAPNLCIETDHTHGSGPAPESIDVRLGVAEVWVYATGPGRLVIHRLHGDGSRYRARAESVLLPIVSAPEVHELLAGYRPGQTTDRDWEARVRRWARARARARRERR